MAAIEAHRKSTPIAKPVLEEVSNAVPFRIQFSTKEIAPRELPDFPYVATRIEFDAVVYTAIVRANDLFEALARIRMYWPEHIAHEAEENMNYFLFSDTDLKSRRFGATEARPPRRWWHLFKFWG